MSRDPAGDTGRGPSGKGAGRIVLALAIPAALVALVALRVDLDPRVEADFFFSESDPQLQESLALESRYPGGELVVVRAEGDVSSPEYLGSVADLEEALANLPGVGDAYSVATEDAGSPLWGRVLVPDGGGATNIVLSLDSVAGPDFTDRLEGVVSAYRTEEFHLVASGVPVIVERIRRSLRRDLRLFSLAALLLFGVVSGIVYRNGRLVGGTLTAGITACAATLVVNDALGIRVGLLTANIVTIVFVLTLSHTVFLIANWRRAPGGAAVRVREAIKRTWTPSLWCMTTTALGFVSLWLTSAEPLRELGTAGVVGTVIALVAAYTVLPLWLPRGSAESETRPAESRPIPLPSLGGAGLVVTGLVAGVVALGILRLQTDPPLLDYFDANGSIRPGLEAIDRSGGSTPLLIAVALPDSSRLDTFQGFVAMSALQDSLESDAAVGVVLSPAPLLAHARGQPLAGFLPISALVAILQQPAFGDLISGYMMPDRTEVLYSLRMIESDRTEPRDLVVERMRQRAEDAGFRVVSVGGLYDLQGRLGELISSSLRIGLGGLLILFFGIAWVVSRSPITSVAMLACLAAIPAIVLGLFGYMGAAVDIITSPAANVALAMGVDSMIHLVTRARELRTVGVGQHWSLARDQLSAPILTATSVIALGFGIFVLSDFPPTRRFGVAVILGTVAAATAALLVLPSLMGRRGAHGGNPDTAAVN
ncbi:MAG: MMPL family transporter [Gemmatimonadetes bacterium]|nr:MMPL family transporter [Gemmatimonadota bacterium]